MNLCSGVQHSSPWAKLHVIARFEVFVVVMIQVEVFWDVMLCSDVKMEAAKSSKTLVSYHITIWYHTRRP
jgi:hypothetical protein